MNQSEYLEAIRVLESKGHYQDAYEVWNKLCDEFEAQSENNNPS